MIFQGKSIRLIDIGHGIVEMCFDRDSDSVNKLDQQTVQELGSVVQALLQINSLKGVLVTSAKEAFIVGADITEFLPLFTQPDNVLREGLRHNNAVFSAFEDLPVPTVVAINGVALGGGFEMCLVADYRVMAMDASVGLPEVKLGIHPGWGGMVRLPRIIGVDNAIEWIASAANKRAEQAMKDGAVDSVVPKEHLRNAALALLHNAISGKLDYKKRRAEKISAIKLNPFEQQMAFSTAKGYIAAQAGPNMPAPLASVKCIEKNANLSRNEALEVEAESFLKVCKTPAATALIGIFLNDQMLNRRNKKFDALASPVVMGGVLGAGIMGGGIAYQSAYKGTPVMMKDIAEQGLQLGLKEAAGLLGKQVERGKMTPEKMAKVMGAIRPTLSYDGFDKLDIVVEAVVENPKVKHAVLSECETHLRDDAILASNTSTISIDYLASVLKRPESFCGMHFFNPVHKMPLVEVIRGSKTSERTIATVVSYAKAMGKTPIVVNDCPGFYVNRVLFPYFMGFDLLLQDGADYRQIDKVMEKFGWPMGPAYLLDVVGIDTAVHAAKVMAQGFPDRMQPAKKSAAEVMFEAQRLGQKNGKGFYVYEMDKKGRPQKQVCDDTADLLKTLAPSTREFTDEEIIARMMLPMCLEVIRCLDEKIVATPGDADLGLVMGLGFPPFRGGPMRYIDTLGVANFLALADQYAGLGKLYAATDSLRQLVANNGRFYS